MRALGLLAVIAVLGAIGCSSDGEAGTTESVDCKTTVGVTKKVFQPKCSTAGCHSAADDPDYVSPGLESRLRGVAAAGCEGQTLVVAGKPDASYLYHKLADAKPACGKPMPYDQPALSPDELACVRDWIAAMPAGADAGVDGSVVDVGTDAGADTSPSCATGLTACAGKCVDTKSDGANCGMCAKACTGGQVCSAGACSSSCPTGTTNCSGSCVDTRTSAANCGACGKACPSGQICTAGACSCGTAVSFATNVQTAIFSKSCATTGCHTGAAPRASLDLSSGKSYAELVNVASSSCSSKVLVTPSDVSKSYLMNKLTGVGMCSGTQMPKTGTTLPAAQLDAVRSWICNGAKNN